MPIGGRQTSWLFTKGDQGFELGTNEKQIPLVAGWRPWTPNLGITTPLLKITRSRRLLEKRKRKRLERK